MGNYQNKEVNASAQAQIVAGQQIESKLNYFGISLIVIMVILGLILVYAIRRGCMNNMRGWLRKEVSRVFTTGGVVPATTATPAAPVGASGFV